MVRKILSSVVVAALLTTSAAPALAQPGYGWGKPSYWGGYGRHRHRGRDDDFGNILLGAVIAGGLFAIASSAAKAKRDRDNGVVYGGDPRPDDRTPERGRWSDTETEAANICADAAESLASRRGVDAKVDDIDFIDRNGDSYRVEGRLQGGRPFNCGVRNGELTHIQFDSRVALR